MCVCICVSPAPLWRSTTSTSNAVTATSATSRRCARRCPTATRCITASWTRGSIFAIPLRCSKRMSKACGGCSMSRRMLIYIGLSSAAPSAPSPWVRVARLPRTIRSTGMEKAVPTSSRVARRRRWCSDTPKSAGCRRSVMCVSNPYGPRDWQPSQGLMVKMAAFGKIPVYVRGVSTEVVGVEDVADAFLLAGECGRIGERYIISETYMSMRELFETAAIAVGARPPRLGVPLVAAKAAGYVASLVSRLLRRDLPLNATGCGSCTRRRRPITARRCENSDGSLVRRRTRYDGRRSSTSSRLSARQRRRVDGRGVRVGDRQTHEPPGVVAHEVIGARGRPCLRRSARSPSARRGPRGVGSPTRTAPCPSRRCRRRRRRSPPRMG